jgi:hypothetical protein
MCKNVEIKNENQENLWFIARSNILIHLICLWHDNSVAKAFDGRTGLCIFYGRIDLCIISTKWRCGSWWWRDTRSLVSAVGRYVFPYPYSYQHCVYPGCKLEYDADCLQCPCVRWWMVVNCHRNHLIGQEWMFFSTQVFIPVPVW